MSRLLIKLHGLNQVNRSFIYRSLGATTAKATANSSTIEENKATPDQLAQVEQKLVTNLPYLFSLPHPYHLYTKDVVLIDNIRNLRVQGVTGYATQIGLIKIFHIINYTSAKLELLNIVRNPEESYVRIRWRVVAKPGFIRMALFFWRFQSEEIWRDGISTMHVNKDGLIHCHTCDNIDADTKELGADQKLKKTIKNPLISRGLNM